MPPGKSWGNVTNIIIYHNLKNIIKFL